MNQIVNLWGLHMGGHVGETPIEQNFVAIGWGEIGDPKLLDCTRERFKQAMRETYPEKKSGAIPVDAGTLFKFIHEIKAGDYVVYPSKSDRMINIGQFTGTLTFVAEDPMEYPNHRGVTWLAQFPRSDFSQSALNEIGSFLTLFRVRTNAEEFLAKVGGGGVLQPALSTSSADEPEDDDSATLTVSRQAQESTEDFIIKRLMGLMTGYQFEEFVAHILECMGYHARVTQKSGDGGVDVIAHRDELGFEPPIIKVQCKRTTSKHGAPEINQLLGILGEGEFGLFVTLGAFSPAAKERERSIPKLRLIDGETFVGLIAENYAKIAPRYRALVPLKQILVPDLPET